MLKQKKTFSSKLLCFSSQKQNLKPTQQIIFTLNEYAMHVQVEEFLWNVQKSFSRILWCAKIWFCIWKEEKNSFHVN